LFLESPNLKEVLRKPFLDTKIRESQVKSLEFSDGKLEKSGLKWKLTAGFIEEK
jgi:hypothetical protein